MRRLESPLAFFADLMLWVVWVLVLFGGSTKASEPIDFAAGYLVGSAAVIALYWLATHAWRDDE